MEWLRLDPTVLGSAEARRAWAIRKSKALAKRRMELESGAPRATGIPLPEALDRYFTAHLQLRARTLVIYRNAAGKLMAWAGKAGIRSADEFFPIMGTQPENPVNPQTPPAAVCPSCTTKTAGALGDLRDDP